VLVDEQAACRQAVLNNSGGGGGAARERCYSLKRVQNCNNEQNCIRGGGRPRANWSKPQLLHPPPPPPPPPPNKLRTHHSAKQSARRRHTKQDASLMNKAAALIEQYHPQEYVWEVNSWAEPEGGYMIWPCCRALAENAPGCQERPPAAAPTQAPDDHAPPVIRVVVSSSNPVKVHAAPCDAAACLTPRCPAPSG
jgi:hypothetical protein